MFLRQVVCIGSCCKKMPSHWRWEWKQWEHAKWQDEKTRALRRLGILASEEDLLYFDYSAKLIRMVNKSVASCTASEQCLWRGLRSLCFQQAVVWSRYFCVQYEWACPEASIPRPTGHYKPSKTPVAHWWRTDRLLHYTLPSSDHSLATTTHHFQLEAWENFRLNDVSTHPRAKGDVISTGAHICSVICKLRV